MSRAGRWAGGAGAVLLVVALAATAWAGRAGRGAGLEDAPARPPVAVPGAVEQPVLLRQVSGTTTASVPAPATAWVDQVASRAGIPAPAVRAYAAATLVTAEQQPACHLGWNTLAGVGWVESQHGTLGGRTLDAAGRSDRPVVGPALDGASFAAVPATTAGAALHGDRWWDHAVGPLQFLPGTWGRWGADGDGDGRADPFDLDDAALAAARYLCADGHDLATPEGWTSAVLTYNHDRTYVAQVLGAANAYASDTAAS